MNWRMLGFFLAVGFLCVHFVGLVRRSRVPQPSPDLEISQRGSWWQLVLASFLTLFAELALIRWIGTEVRIFAYVKNLALLVCFLGFGAGCALARRPVRWWTSVVALLGLIMAVRWPWHSEHIFESLSSSLGAGQEFAVWATDSVRNWPNLFIAAFLTAALLFLITYLFIPLGQIVSRELELAARPLQGYSWNLAASLVGIFGFFAVSWLALPPAVWMAVIFVGIGLLQNRVRQGLLFASLSIPAALLLHDVSTPLHFTSWTPYQQISVTRYNFPDGEFKDASVQVNHTGYQSMVNLSPEFLARHPGLLKEAADENPYNLPFAFAARIAAGADCGVRDGQ